MKPLVICFVLLIFYSSSRHTTAGTQNYEHLVHCGLDLTDTTVHFPSSSNYFPFGMAYGNTMNLVLQISRPPHKKNLNYLVQRRTCKLPAWLPAQMFT